MRDIILIALEQEAPSMAKWDNVFFTGVGKVNAALTAAKLIERHNPRTVWNFGTAGGIKLDKGLFEMKNFVERDKGECPPAIEVAKACINQHVEFKCYKFVSDSADNGADTDWLENVSKGEPHFIEIFQQVTEGY